MLGAVRQREAVSSTTSSTVHCAPTPLRDIYPSSNFKLKPQIQQLSNGPLETWNSNIEWN